MHQWEGRDEVVAIVDAGSFRSSCKDTSRLDVTHEQGRRSA